MNMRSIKTLMLSILILFIMGSTVSAQTDVVLMVDLSGTMTANDLEGKRYDAADQFLTLFGLYGRDFKYRAGVISFGNRAEERIKLDYVSDDKAGMYQGILKQLPIEEWTELGQALELGRQQMQNSSARTKSFIVVSDGWVEGDPHARGMVQEPARQAAISEIRGQILPALRKAGIKVYTIGLHGNDTKGVQMLKEIAETTGGFYESVTNPEQFSKIYRKVLDRIDAPSRIELINTENNRVLLSPADNALIITGPRELSILSPDGRTYPLPKGETASTGVRQLYVPYSDGSAILFLGKPEKLGQLAGQWTGEWAVNIKGEGQATLLTWVRLNHANNLPPRSDYFVNEYLQMHYQMVVLRDVGDDVKSILEACEAEYTIVSEDSNSDWSGSDQLKSEKPYEFSGERLLEKQGKYRLEVRVLCNAPPHGKIKILSLPQTIYVHDADLLSFNVMHLDGDNSTPVSDLEVGERYRIEVVKNLQALTKGDSGMKTLDLSNLTLKLNYSSGASKDVSLKDKGMISEEFYCEEEGQIAINADASGSLIKQFPDRKELTFYPLKLKSKKLVKGSSHYTLQDFVAQSFYALTALTTLMTVYVFFNHKQWKGLEDMRLVGSRNRKIDVALGADASLKAGEKWRRDFKGAHITVGGIRSNADIQLGAEGDEILAELGRNILGNFYIRSTGARQIYLRSKANPLKPNSKEAISPGDLIFIDGMDAMTFESIQPD